MEKYIKIALIILFALCLFPMPYGFYILVRFLAMIGFVLLAYWEQEKGENKELAIVYGGLALLFQPFFKIALGRVFWNIVDVTAIIFLIIQLKRKR